MGSHAVHKEARLHISTTNQNYMDKNCGQKYHSVPYFHIQIMYKLVSAKRSPEHCNMSVLLMYVAIYLDSGFATKKPENSNNIQGHI